MNCQEFWNTMPEFVDAAASANHKQSANHRHLADCRECAARLRSQRALHQGLRAVAGQMSRAEAPARVEARLRTAFRAHGGMAAGAWRETRPIVPRAMPPVLTWAAAAAVLFALALFLMRGRQPEVTRPAVGRGADLAVAGMPAEIDSQGDTQVVDNGFLPLPNAAQIGPNEDVNLVRVEVPRSAMIALGFDVRPEEASERVQADVMLGNDGLARAVRFID